MCFCVVGVGGNDDMIPWDILVDEIYTQVTYLEPWVAGKGIGTPSTAFCLLYKLFTLRLSVKQIRVLLRHKDSPYIRALGFLYLRFGANPRELWSWFEPYLEDDEPIVLKYNSPPTTIGKFVRDLLTKPKFFDVVLPRIPVVVQREVDRQLNERFPPPQQVGSDKKRWKEEEKEEENNKVKRFKQSAKEPQDNDKREATVSSSEQSLSPQQQQTTTKKANPNKLESHLYLQDLKQRYGDTSGRLDVSYATQVDSEPQSSSSQLPTAVKSYLQQTFF
jgi:hypothetical protein